MIDVLSGLVRDGRIVEIALAVILAEAAALALSAVRGKPWRLASLLHLAAGACLLLALRAALLDAQPMTILTWLGGALIAHVADLPRRWRS